jgi:hypothetical protein
MVTGEDKVQLVDYTDSSFSESKTDTYHLSIELDKDGIGACVFDPEENRFIAVHHHPFEHGLETIPEKEIADVLNNTELFSYQYKSVSAAVVGEQSTLVPKALYDVQSREKYLQLNLESSDNVTIHADPIVSADAFNVYYIPTGLKDILVSKYPNIRVLHYSTVIIEKAVLLNRKKETNTIYVTFHGEHFELTVIQKGKLHFYNSYTYQSPEDFLYYLLFVCDQLTIDPQKISFMLAGDVKTISPLIVLLKQYVTELDFIKRDRDYNYGSFFFQIPEHHHFTLLSQYICA